MSKPLLLVDVDGVLCPFGWGPHSFDGNASPEVADEIAKQKYPGYEYNAAHHIHISPENAKRLKRLSNSFDLVWCTGWVDEANEVIGPLHGLPKLPVIQVYSLALDVHWKFDSIQKYVGNRPYAFIDDDIHADGLAYAKHRNKSVPTLWLPIKCNIGLTDDHVETLEEFAKECQITSSS